MNRRSFLALSTLSAVNATPSRAISLDFHNLEIVLPPEGGVRTGGCRMIEVGGGHRVWTKKVGYSPIKVLLLHGGPGGNYAYFECFEDFLPRNGIEFYYYDQLDSLNSDQPGDSTLWTISRFRDEIEAVRRGLGLENFYLYGHSWGGLLAIEYALAYPEHLKGLIISNMEPSASGLARHLAVLRAQLPPAILADVKKYEQSDEYDNPEYQKAMDFAYHRNVCRLETWPEPVTRNFRTFNHNVYNFFQGNNEFVISGAMKGWDRWADLSKIKTRTLCIGARYDEMNPDDIRRMSELLPNGEVWISQTGSHLTMWDDQVPYFKTLLRFLKS